MLANGGITYTTRNILEYTHTITNPRTRIQNLTVHITFIIAQSGRV